mgnify:CR=1 FL=1
MNNKITKSIIIQPVSEIVGNSHRYTSIKGEISLLYPSWATMDMYEIYCIKGNLFEDIERFETLKEAEERIIKLLE